MKQLSYILIVLTSFAINSLAQDATPTPPPAVDDKQNVKPENLQGVPPIAPQYQSNDKNLPDLGRVGVDMLEQKSLSLREAIAKALENNKDIEVSRKNVKAAEFDLQAADSFMNRDLAAAVIMNMPKLLRSVSSILTKPRRQMILC